MCTKFSVNEEYGAHLLLCLKMDYASLYPNVKEYELEYLIWATENEQLKRRAKNEFRSHGKIVYVPNACEQHR